MERRVRSSVTEDPVQEFKQRTEEKLRDVRCPRHHQAPRVKFLGSSLPEITIQMSGCCKQLIDLANRAIAERP
jgi:hypothetical protein